MQLKLCIFCNYAQAYLKTLEWHGRVLSMWYHFKSKNVVAQAHDKTKPFLGLWRGTTFILGWNAMLLVNKGVGFSCRLILWSVPFHVKLWWVFVILAYSWSLLGHIYFLVTMFSHDQILLKVMGLYTMSVSRKRYVFAVLCLQMYWYKTYYRCISCSFPNNLPRMCG